MNQASYYIIAIVVFLVLVVSTMVSWKTFRKDSWYQSLNKSSLQPPGWVFSVVWIVLYFFIAYSWMSSINMDKYAIINGLFSANIILNMLWSILFSQGQILYSLLVIFVLIATTIAIMVLLKDDTTAFVMMLCYAFWLLIASYLNAYIVFNNHNLQK